MVKVFGAADKDSPAAFVRFIIGATPLEKQSNDPPVSSALQTASRIFYPLALPLMDKPAPNPELLRSLGRLTRGLSALFWGLPASLVFCAETARTDWFKPWAFVPALIATALPLYGLWLMGGFQKQERPWRGALDRAELLGLVNLGLCPFLYWHYQLPAQPFFNAAISVLALSAVLFLFNLNVVIKQLGAMLPDETLRHETRQFTALNRTLLAVLLFLGVAYVVLLRDPRLPNSLGLLFDWLQDFGFWGLTLFALLPLAMTMALIWKTKEIILDSVFSAK